MKWLGGFVLLLSLLAHEPARAATLTAIEVTPGNPTINVGQTQPFTATGTYDDGSRRPLLPGAVSVSASFQFTCAVLSDGRVQCWGANDIGQLGTGTTESSSRPVAVSGITTAVAVAAGSDHACAVLSGGGVQCWGANGTGQLGDRTTVNSFSPVMVSGVTTAVAIAAGGAHTCAVLSGGGVQCWGANFVGQLGTGTDTGPELCGDFPCRTTPVPVSGLSNAMAIAAGGAHTCAVLSDGRVQCWGANDIGQLGIGTDTGPELCGDFGPCSTIPVSVSGLSTATAIAAGGATCALLSNGRVQCWGSNSRGELGNGTTVSSSLPVAVSSITTAVAVAAGGGHTCAVLSGGGVQCWGSNGAGELGTGTTTGPESCPSADACSTTPVAVAGITTAVAVAAGLDHTCAVLSGGGVQCWGQNGSGQLGIGTTVFFSSPVTVSGITTAVEVGAGFTQTCAVLSGGGLQCWGSNSSGQLGNGTTVSSSTPVAVSGITTAVTVAAGGGHTCALLADGQVQCWGANSVGQLGNGTSGFSAFSSSPVTVSGITTAVAIALGTDHSCAVLADGRVQCWGGNFNGQLGTGTPLAGGISATGPESCGPLGQACSTTPVTVVHITTAVGVAAGNNLTCAVLADGRVQCWGNNFAGGFGNGTAGFGSFSSSPVTTSGITTAVAVVAGSLHTCAVLSDGGVRCWGSNLLGDGTTVGFSSTPVAVSGIMTAVEVALGSEHTCAVLSGGGVQCWGGNGGGQLGIGTTTGPELCFFEQHACSTLPVAVGGITTAVALAAGSGHTCAVLADGRVKCWGANFNGQLGNGTAGIMPSPVDVLLIGLRWTSSDPGVASIDANGLATGRAAGTVTITAALGDISGSTLLTVAGAPVLLDQAITFGALGNKTYGDVPLIVSATGGASGNPVAFTAAPAGVCASSGVNGSTITIVGAGICTVTAHQIGNSTYNAAPDVPQSFMVDRKLLTVTADSKTKVLHAPLPPFTASFSGFVNGETLATSAVMGSPSLTTTAIASSPVGSYAITAALGTLAASNYSFTFVDGTLSIQYATSGVCGGGDGHTIRPPIRADNTGVFKHGSTVPAKFRVCDANGVSIGTPGVVASFRLIRVVSGTVVNVVDEAVDSTTPDTAFRWDASGQQWIFNIGTKSLSPDATYSYRITLNDGSTIDFSVGLK
jgi:alpha-tubulin suppressor-like RCC1 family protein